MTKESRKSFFSAVASAMLNYKQYPTANDYRNVAASILDKYEFFKSPVREELIKPVCVCFIVLCC